MKTLVLGGARSGKSRYAEQLAENNSANVIYVATATVGDSEMAERIKKHQLQRPASWQLIEEPLGLSDVLLKNDKKDHCILVDCLTLWLSNWLAHETIDIAQKSADLVNVINQMQADVILVSNEVGQGIVPMGELSRRFVDESGRLHQQLAQVCDRVVFTVAGLPQILK